MGNLLARLFVLSLISLFMADLSFAAAYIDNKDGTVTDTQHGLMWQKSDDGVERVWEDANKYCEDLKLAGYTDWRLPSINLLEGLIETSNSPTAPAVFSVKPSYYWSASESHNNTQSAKYVNFFYGNTYAYSKDNTYYVICVRDTAREQENNLTASFSETIEGGSPFEIHFNSEITGGSAPYFIEWDFGDGETSSVQTPTHVFTAPGTYKIQLTVSDNDGTVTSASKKLVLPQKMEGIAQEEKAPLETELQSKIPGHEENAAEEAVKRTPPIPLAQKESAGSGTLDNSAGQKITPGNAPKVVPKEGETIETNLTAPVTSLKALESSSKADDQSSEVSPVTPPAKEEALPGLTEKQVTPPASRPPVPSNSAGTPKTAITALANRPGHQPFLEVLLKVKNTAEISSLGHDLLAYAFGNAMHGDADWNKDGEITAHELKGYLSMAVENLSQGKTEPVIKVSGEDFGICASHGTTYVLAVGVDLYQDNFVPQPFVKQDVSAIQKAIAEKCSDSKTLVLTGEHANRAEFLQSLKKIGGMLGPNDQLIFYFAGDSERQGNRLNLFFNDTIKGMTAFTGLFYEDIAAFVKGGPGTGATILLETVDAGGPEIKPPSE